MYDTHSLAPRIFTPKTRRCRLAMPPIRDLLNSSRQACSVSSVFSHITLFPFFNVLLRVISFSASGPTLLRGLRAPPGPNAPTLPGHGRWRFARSHQPLETPSDQTLILGQLACHHSLLYVRHSTRHSTWFHFACLRISCYSPFLLLSFSFLFPLFWARRLTVGGYLWKDMGHEPSKGGFNLTLWRRQG
jgi:hypothetical protein